jgi:hypothetical protein
MTVSLVLSDYLYKMSYTEEKEDNIIINIDKESYSSVAWIKFIFLFEGGYTRTSLKS